MQPSARPDALPHTRTHLVHWAATAVAVAAVVGLSAVIQPPHARAGQTDGAAAGTAEDGPDANLARYPMDCGAQPEPAVSVLATASSDFDQDGRAETVALVRCDAPAGTPPSGIFVLAHPAATGGRPQVVETLLSPEEGMSAQDFTVREREGRKIAATLLGYSSADVPRCCPDRQRKVTWEWREGRFVLVPEPVAQGI